MAYQMDRLLFCCVFVLRNLSILHHLVTFGGALFALDFRFDFLQSLHGQLTGERYLHEITEIVESIHRVRWLSPRLIPQPHRLILQRLEELGSLLLGPRPKLLNPLLHYVLLRPLQSIESLLTPQLVPRPGPQQRQVRIPSFNNNPVVRL